MSVAPDLIPDVLIPARARRGPGRSRTVSGNVIIVTAFVDVPADATAQGPERVDRRRGLRLVAVAPDAIRSSPTMAFVEPGRSASVVGSAAKLTARGRVVVAIASVAAALAIVVGAWFSAGSPASSPSAPVAAQVVVHDGDTLWTIAGRVAPNADPRSTVERLVRMNRLTSVDLVPGQVLRTG